MLSKYGSAFAILFWQVVNLAVFGYSLAFLFFPTDANKIFTVSQSTAEIRWQGVLYLLSAAGLNQMISGYVIDAAMTKRCIYSMSCLLYILAGSAGIVVLVLHQDLFIHEQYIAFLVLFSLFTLAILLGFLYLSFGMAHCKRATAEITAVVTELPVTQKRSVPRSRAEILASSSRY